MSSAIREDKLASIEIDLTQKSSIDESWLRMFGENIKNILKAMFGDAVVPVRVKGAASDVRAFTKALGSEKRYISTLREFGLDNPRTYKSRASLDKASAEFQRKTGIAWPFK